MDEMYKPFLDSINVLPPLIRYPTLLVLAEILAEELPKAEEAYNNEKAVMLERFLEVIKER